MAGLTWADTTWSATTWSNEPAPPPPVGKGLSWADTDWSATTWETVEVVQPAPVVAPGGSTGIPIPSTNLYPSTSLWPEFSIYDNFEGGVVFELSLDRLRKLLPFRAAKDGLLPSPKLYPGKGIEVLSAQVLSDSDSTFLIDTDERYLALSMDTAQGQGVLPSRYESASITVLAVADLPIARERAYFASQNVADAATINLLSDPARYVIAGQIFLEDMSPGLVAFMSPAGSYDIVTVVLAKRPFAEVRDVFTGELIEF